MGMMDRPPEYDQIVQQLIEAKEGLRADGYTEAEITSLFDRLRREQNASDMETLRSDTYQSATERNGVANGFINVIAGTGKGLGYYDLMLQNLFGGKDVITGQKRPVDYNSPLQSLYYIDDATMQGEMDKLMEKYGTVDENGEVVMSERGKHVENIYRLSVLAGTAGTELMLNKMGPQCAALLLSANAGVDVVHEFHKRGFSDEKAFLMGTIASALEYAAKTIEIDDLLKEGEPSKVKQVLRDVLSTPGGSAVFEGGERGVFPCRQ